MVDRLTLPELKAKLQAEKQGLSKTSMLHEKAVKYFQERPPNFPDGRPFNCAESVLLALSEYLGVESEFIPRIATGVGAGFSLNGLTCGCVSGAAMAFGLKYGRDTNYVNPKPTWDKVDKFIEAFKNNWGSLTCRELTGVDVKSPEGMKKYLSSIHDYSCTERVKYTILESIKLMEAK